ncbi:hypothetical protein SMICM17S_04559 [Streptomyces microflavus]
MSWLSRFSLAQRALIGLISIVALVFGAIAIPQLPPRPSASSTASVTPPSTAGDGPVLAQDPSVVVKASDGVGLKKVVEAVHEIARSRPSTASRAHLAQSIQRISVAGNDNVAGDRVRLRRRGHLGGIVAGASRRSPGPAPRRWRRRRDRS